jgi:PAS domain S-box-containing protein
VRFTPYRDYLFCGKVSEISQQENAMPTATSAQANEAVPQSGAEYARSLIEASLDPMVAISAEGKITDVNEATVKVTGICRQKLIGTDFPNYFTDPEKAREGYRQALSCSFVSDYPMTIRHCEGRLTDVLTNASVYRDTHGNVLGVFAVARDVTAQKRLAAEVAAAHTQQLEAARRDVLLREIHHGVKNNLQVIASLLYLQSQHVTDPKMREILKKNQIRVKCIALIHEKLHRSSDVAMLDFGEYVRDLAADLFRTYAVSDDAVSLNTRVESVRVKSNMAIPGGLIISELIGNAFTHAFPLGRKGRVDVSLIRAEDGALNLSIGDDGVGMPKGFNWSKPTSFGLKLVMDLTKQLDATIELNTHAGSSFKITFKEAQ